MSKEEEKGQGADRIFKYLTETPDEKYAELTKLYRRQVLPLTWMQTTEDGIGLINIEIKDLEDWYIKHYGKEGGKEKEWVAQIKKDRENKEFNPSVLMKKFRLYLYQHLRSVDGGQLIRMTALAETEMTSEEEEDEPEIRDGQ